jgi:hypothetical protein
MSEETQDHNDGTWSGLKKTIIGLVTTVVLGAGGVITNKFIGGGEESCTSTTSGTCNQYYKFKPTTATTCGKHNDYKRKSC